ncbi:hypothetical protein DICA4_D20472 [Diutina catenulata]
MGRPRKNACSSCRRMKIKCDEATPRCEYCAATNKVCEYDPVPRAVSRVKKCTKDSKPAPKMVAKAIGMNGTDKPAPLTADSDNESPDGGPKTVSTASPVDDYFAQAELLPEPFEQLALDDLLDSQVATGVENINLEYQPLDFEPIYEYSSTGQEPLRTYYDEADAYEFTGQVPLEESLDIVPPIELDCPIGSSPILRRLNSVASQMGLSIFEYRLLHFFDLWAQGHYNASRFDPQKIIWTQVVPDLFMTSELVKRSIFAYSGMLLLNHHNPNYLLGNPIADDDPSLPVVYQQSIAHFNHQVSEIGRLTQELQAGICSPQNSAALVMSSSFMFFIIGFHPLRMMPVVDFVNCKNDYISMVQGLNETITVARPLIELTPMRVIFTKNLDPAPYVLPLYQRFLDFLGNPICNDVDKEYLTEAIYCLNDHVYRCVDSNSELPIYGFLVHGKPQFYRLVYQKHPVALGIIYMYCAHAMMVKFYFIRTMNIWVDFIEWYKSQQESNYGGWYFPWDGPLYRLVIEKQYTPSNLQEFRDLDARLVQ